ncbi:MAG: hypothetical protein JWP01_3312 [Myxococcales bacterium]|nr:hypothetical protein [Myxococcales bacterium]
MNAADYLLRAKPMSFQMSMTATATVFIVPAADDVIQRSIAASVGSEIDLHGKARVARCFLAPFRAAAGMLRDELPLAETGDSSFNEVFSRYWAQEHQGLPLSPETPLFVLVLG